MGKRGLEHTPDSPKNTPIPDSSGAESGAPGAQSTPTPPADPTLAKLVEAWPTLPEAVRAGIAAMIDASAPKG